VGARLERPALLGDADRIEALTAAHHGDLDSAVVASQSAVAAHSASPLRIEAARSLLVLGRIQRRRRARKSSRDALNRSLALASSIGHRPLIDEVESELERVASVRTGSELTTSELKVAELIAQGATNREASEALFVSVRTIETHVASIYRKLGVRSRTELTRRLTDSPTSPGGVDRP
jgi:DNA-binding NarL/FixJ family response regulator